MDMIICAASLRLHCICYIVLEKRKRNEMVMVMVNKIYIDMISGKFAYDPVRSHSGSLR
jgi:hypothetical protein